MEPSKIAKQMVDFQKTAFENAFNTVVLLQEQAERVTNTVLEQTLTLPEQGQKVLAEWTKTCKKSRDEFKKAVEAGYQNLDSAISGTKKSTKAKAAK